MHEEIAARIETARADTWGIGALCSLAMRALEDLDQPTGGEDDAQARHHNAQLAAALEVIGAIDGRAGEVCELLAQAGRLVAEGGPA